MLRSIGALLLLQAALAAGQNVDCAAVGIIGSACEATAWCRKLRVGTTFSCVPNVTCGAFSATECSAQPPCAFGGTFGNNGAQCDGYSGGVYSTNQNCFYGSAGGSSGASTSGGGNACLARNASGFMGNLYPISGITAGRTSITDGGNDMYDTGNIMQVSGVTTPPVNQRRNNQCFSVRSASFMGNLYSITGISTGGTSISDGGRDMYDTGNRIRVRAGSSTSSDLRYTNCGAQTTARGDVMYSTCWSNGYFTASFTSASNQITGFYVVGNLGADGQGNVNGGQLSTSNGFLSFYKSVDDRQNRDPTVNHLVTLPAGRGTWRQSYSSSTDSDQHSVTSTSTSVGVPTLFYVLYADPSNEGRHSRTLFQNLANNVISGCLGSGTPSRSVAMPYTTCSSSRNAGVADISYSTCYNSGYFVTTLRSASNAIAGFQIGGNLGADGQGTSRNGSLPAIGGWQGFYRTVDDGRTADPTVNQLILVKSRSPWTQSASSSTNIDSHSVAGPGVAQIVYILYADPPADSTHSPALFARLMAAYIYGCDAPGNDCFASSAASAVGGSLYSISGINVGSTSIGDGGNDMYDGGNILSYAMNGSRTSGATVTWPNNNCFSATAARSIGALHSISGISTGSTYIGDGGSDMYDNGNYLYIGTSRGTVNVRYTSCGRYANAGTGDVRYQTCWSGRFFTATFLSASASINLFRVTGDLGADNQGNVVAASLGASSNGQYYGFYKSVDDRQNRDPTVNHLMLVNRNNWRHTYATNTNDDRDQIQGGTSASEVIYVLFGNPRTSSRNSRTQFTQLFNAVAGGCLTGGGSTQSITYTACGSSTSGPTDSTYSTCYSDRFFTARVNSPSSSISGFTISGNLGADGSGRVAGGTLGASADGSHYGFYKTVHDGRTGDPTVNQLIIVNSRGWSQTYSSSTDSDSHSVSGPGTTSLIYVLFGTPPAASSPSASVFSAIMNSVISGCASSTFQSNVMLSSVSACNAASGCRWNPNGTAPNPVCAAYVNPPPPPPTAVGGGGSGTSPALPTPVVCATIAGGSQCSSTPWCQTQVVNATVSVCAPNISCSAITDRMQCNMQASCSYVPRPTYAGPQCNGWTGNTYFQSDNCFFGQFDPSSNAASSGTNQTVESGNGNSCLASNASTFMPVLYPINGIFPGQTSITDGGGDMYDVGNTMRVSATAAASAGNGARNNQCFSTSSASFMGNLYSISGISTGATSISDGGGDMYDVGNYIRVRSGSSTSSNLRYTACGAYTTATGNVQYYTCWSNGYFRAEFRSTTSSITGFYVSGNLGADGSGNTVGGSLGQSTTGGWYGFYKSVDDRRTGDPTVNHVVAVPTSGWRQSYSTSTDSDTHSVVSPSTSRGVARLTYVLYADPSAESRHSVTLFRQLFNNIVSGCNGPAAAVQSSPLRYTGCTAPGTAGVGDVLYSTCHAGGYMVTNLYSRSGGLTAFNISGNLGADGQGTVQSGALTPVAGMQAFYKTVEDGTNGDPSVNHLVLIKGVSGWNQTASTSTDSDSDVYMGTNATQIIYILFSTSPSQGAPSTALLQQLAGAAAYGCAPPANTCFASRASSLVGSLYTIQGIVAGRTSISDGGSDMYDTGNQLTIGDNLTVSGGAGGSWGSNNNCVLSSSVTSWINSGRGLHSISGVSVGGTSIGDGGSDMYDNGNYLRVQAAGRTSGYLSYTACGAERSAGVGDVRYSTCWSNRLFTAKVTSAGSQLTQFAISGDLGADGQGNALRGSLGQSNSGGWYGFYKSVDDRQNRDPTVNHVLAVNAPGWSQSASTSTHSDSHSISGRTAASAIVYVLFADNRYDSRHSTTQFSALFNSVVSNCVAPPATVSSYLPYTQCGVSRSAGAGDITYTTCYSNGYFVATFRSGFSAISSFGVSGNLGADGAGRVAGGSLGLAADGRFYGFYKTVDDGRTSDPTVNHLVLVNSPGWRQSYPTSTNLDTHTLTGPGASTLVYILFANPPSASAHATGVFQNLMNTVVSGCLNSVWRSYTPYNNAAGCNQAVGCQWNQNGVTLETSCGDNLVPPPTSVAPTTAAPSVRPTAAPTRSPTLHACAPGQTNSCDNPSTFCSDNVANVPVSLQLNAGTTGAYTCVCNTQQGYTVRVNSYTCGTTSPSAAPTTTPTSSPTGNPCAPGQNNSCHAPSTFCSNRINSGRPIVGGVGAGQYVCECAVSRGFTIPLSGYECGTSAPTTATPTSTPTTPPPTDAAASSGPLGSVGGGGGGFSVIIIIAIAIVIAALIIGFALYKRKANDGGGASDTSRVQFENPMYEDNTATAEDYSEMNGAEETGGYMDVGDESKGGYLDVEGANGAEDLYDESAEKYDSDEDM